MGTTSLLYQVNTKEPTIPTTIIQRLKVFCVGVGGSGKTSLLKRIQEEPYFEGRKETIGLEIAEIPIEQLLEKGAEKKTVSSENEKKHHQLKQDE